MSEPVAVPVSNERAVTSVDGAAADPPKQVHDTVEVEPSPSISEKPYVAKFYEIDNMWGDLSPDIQEAGETIMEYYKQQVADQKIADTKEAFQDFMKHLERTTDVKHAPTHTKLKVISEFIKYLTKIKPYK